MMKKLVPGTRVALCPVNLCPSVKHVPLAAVAAVVGGYHGHVGTPPMQVPTIDADVATTDH